MNITHHWAMVGQDLSLYLVVREFLNTDPAFKAFEGLPITPEFRLFTKNGRARAWQPYWPSKAIEDPDCVDWESRLQWIQVPLNGEIDKMIEWSEMIAQKLGGDWSVDFLRDKDNQLFLIDMAESYKSYVSEDVQFFD